MKKREYQGAEILYDQELAPWYHFELITNFILLPFQFSLSSDFQIFLKHVAWKLLRTSRNLASTIFIHRFEGDAVLPTIFNPF